MSLIKITEEIKVKIKEEVKTVVVFFVFFEVLSLIAAVIVCGINWLHGFGKDTYSIFKIAPIIAVAFTVIFYAATKLFSGSDGYGCGRKRPRIPIKGGWY